MKTYQCAGDAGDLIYGCCAIRALGGGVLCLHAEKWTREPMTQSKVDSIRTLLIQQPYIKDVRWLRPGEKATVNLNDFRSEYFRTFRSPDFPKRRNLCEWILRTHGCDPKEQGVQWLSVVPDRRARVIVSRTPRYQNTDIDWKRLLKRLLHYYQRTFGFQEVRFVGTSIEHTDFENAIGDVLHTSTPDLLTLAQVIAGADLFIGNQSLPYAIAEGLKKRAVLEVCPWLPNCLFEREGVTHGWDGNVALPELHE